MEEWENPARKSEGSSYPLPLRQPISALYLFAFVFSPTLTEMHYYNALSFSSNAARGEYCDLRVFFGLSFQTLKLIVASHRGLPPRSAMCHVPCAMEYRSGAVATASAGCYQLPVQSGSCGNPPDLPTAQPGISSAPLPALPLLPPPSSLLDARGTVVVHWFHCQALISIRMA